MITGHLLKVIDRLAALPADQPEAAAAQIEIFLDEGMSVRNSNELLRSLPTLKRQT